jgi:dienelactone hydrolase
VAADVAVVRFDWAYRTADPAHGVQSNDLAAEVEDMTTALHLLDGDPHLDHGRIILMGKSLGSMVAWPVLAKRPDVKAAVLLAPLCTLPASVSPSPWRENIYPGFADHDRPIALIGGQSDPLCRNEVLYRVAGAAKGPIRIAIVGGDHSFVAGPGVDAATQQATERNLELAVNNAVDTVLGWVRR